MQFIQKKQTMVFGSNNDFWLHGKRHWKLLKITNLANPMWCCVLLALWLKLLKLYIFHRRNAFLNRLILHHQCTPNTPAESNRTFAWHWHFWWQPFWETKMKIQDNFINVWKFKRICVPKLPIYRPSHNKNSFNYWKIVSKFTKYIQCYYVFVFPKRHLFALRK